MLRGIIRGNIVSTRKQESLIGSKFMEVEIMKNGELTGEESIKNYSFSLESGWNIDNCSIYAIAIDHNGYVNNVAVCPLNGSSPYDYAK